jgi:hypothetical protein
MSPIPLFESFLGAGGGMTILANSFLNYCLSANTFISITYFPAMPTSWEKNGSLYCGRLRMGADNRWMRDTIKKWSAGWKTGWISRGCSDCQRYSKRRAISAASSSSSPGPADVSLHVLLTRPRDTRYAPHQKASVFLVFFLFLSE